MVEQPDIHSLPDAQPDVDKLGGLADAPPTALGLSPSDADALEQVLGVRSVRELADNKGDDQPGTVLPPSRTP